MTTFTLVLLALGLSMDAFAVSISNGMCYKNLSHRQRFANSFSFGLFQAIMPIIGFFAGRLLGSFMAAVDHWVALLLLGFIGGKMIWEGYQAIKEPESCPAESTYTFKTMILQSVATSIDALAVGISLAALSADIWVAAAAIGVITMVCCLIASELGRRFGALLGDWAEIAGGVILLGIGIKIFVEHMFG